MSYEAFLSAFAAEHGVRDAEALLTDHAERFSFQINSRDRARKAIATVLDAVPLDLSRARILDVGCAYGSFAIEFAKLGAEVTGVDVSEKWLRLAEINADGEARPAFIRCDASTRSAAATLAERGPFDLVVVNDVFEHIYDTVGLLANLSAVMQPGAFLYYKVPNGLATRNVISEGHKKKFGISLLPPDYWGAFVSAPFNIYYRRKGYFDALFNQFNFSLARNLNDLRDKDAKTTRAILIKDAREIREALKANPPADPQAAEYLRQACRHYFAELREDLAGLAWPELFAKYRVTFWEGVLQFGGKVSYA